MKKNERVARPRRAQSAEPIMLSEHERAELRKILCSEVFKKALLISDSLKPAVGFVGASTQCHMMNDAAMATLAANNRLHEIRGWELFEAALYSAANDVKPMRPQVLETYNTTDENQ